MKPTLLIIDDDRRILEVLSQFFREDYEVVTADRGAEGIERFKETGARVTLLDLDMPDMWGLDVLARIKQIDQDASIIILTAYGDIESAVKAMKMGADHFLTKPVDHKALESVISKSVKTAKIQQNYEALKSRLEKRKEKVILPSKVWKAVELMAANSDTTVLLTGPTGAGKGVVAELIHSESARCDSPFVDINCAGLSEGLLESELFGHEAGAFTDAKERKRGLMEVSNGGTLFLDEIGEMPAAVQGKVLKAIETKTFRRVGGTSTLKSDVRIIAATNIDLEKKIGDGKFREDLFYRLNVLPIALPPLSKRKDDILTLAERFLEEFSAKNNRNIRGFSPEAIEQLKSYRWPGNIRELKNVVERATIICEGDSIGVNHLTLSVNEEAGKKDQAEDEELLTLDQIEKKYILRVLSRTDNNKAAAARILGIDVKTLSRKISS